MIPDMVECNCGASDWKEAVRGKEVQCAECEKYFLLERGVPKLSTGQDEPYNAQEAKEQAKWND